MNKTLESKKNMRTPEGEEILFTSTAGDERFSAMKAEVKIGDVTDTIENWYQNCKRDASDKIPGKGKPVHHIVWAGKTISVDMLSEIYYLLWYKYLSEKKDLLEYASKFDIFYDQFGGSSINRQDITIKQIIELYKYRKTRVKYKGTLQDIIIELYRNRKTRAVLYYKVMCTTTNKLFTITDEEINGVIAKVNLPKHRISLSEAVEIAADLMQFINRGGTVCNQNGSIITKELIVSTVNYIHRVTPDKHINKKGIVHINIDKYSKQLKRVVPDRGMAESKLIKLSNLYEDVPYDFFYKGYLLGEERPEIQHYIGVRDDTYYSAGVVDLVEPHYTYKRCIFDFKIVIGVLPNWEPDAITEWSIYNEKIKRDNKFTGEKENLSLKQRYKYIRFVRLTQNRYTKEYYVYKKKYYVDATTIERELVKNILYLCDLENLYEKLDEYGIQEIVDNFTDYVNIMIPYNILKEISLPCDLREELDYYIYKLIKEGKYSTKEDVSYYERFAEYDDEDYIDITDDDNLEEIDEELMEELEKAEEESK